jgi:GxxExxY protein
MNTEEEENDPVSYAVIGAAMEVHRHLGPGLLESLYHRAMLVELALRGIPYQSQEPVEVYYKEQSLGKDLRIDLVVQGELIVEMKSVDELHPVHEAQLMTYMKLTKLRKGLLLNFNTKLLKNGIRRRVL